MWQSEVMLKRVEWDEKEKKKCQSSSGGAAEEQCERILLIMGTEKGIISWFSV